MTNTTATALQRPLSAQQLLQKFGLNAGLDEAAAKRAWRDLRGWQRAADIHTLFTPMCME